MNYSTATTSQIIGYRENWITFSEMMTFWKLKGMSSFQGKMCDQEKTRIQTDTDTIVIVHHSDYSSEMHTIESMVIYEGSGYSFRAPIFETHDRSTAMTKLQEFF